MDIIDYLEKLKVTIDFGYSSKAGGGYRYTLVLEPTTAEKREEDSLWTLDDLWCDMDEEYANIRDNELEFEDEEAIKKFIVEHYDSFVEACMLAYFYTVDNAVLYDAVAYVFYDVHMKIEGKDDNFYFETTNDQLKEIWFLDNIFDPDI